MDTKEKKRTASVAPGKKAGNTTRKVSRGTAHSAPTQRKRATAAANVKRKQPATKAAAEVKRTRNSKKSGRSAAAPKPKSGETRKIRPTPDVVYTPAKPFSRSRLLLQLVTVVAVVLALTFGMSIFFKVEHVMVYGAEKYDAWTIKNESGIQEGDNLLGFGEIQAVGKIQAALPYVKNVRIGIKLPDTVNIIIEELDVAYAVQDGADRWWLITADGKVLEETTVEMAESYTQILGVRIADPVANQQAYAWEYQADSTDPTAEPAVITVSAQERLNTALSILQYLEDNSVMGLVATVDVEDLADIELWYGQQYQVRLGDSSQLSYKVRCMCEAVAQLKDYDTGLLDISFMLIQDQVIYEPFLE